MKKLIFIFVFVLLMSLGACKKQEEKTYLYQYAVTKDNYESFFEVKHEEKAVDDKKNIVTTFSLLDENDLADEVEIEMTLTLVPMYSSSYSPTEKTYEILFDHKNYHVHTMT